MNFSTFLNGALHGTPPPPGWELQCQRLASLERHGPSKLTLQSEFSTACAANKVKGRLNCVLIAHKVERVLGFAFLQGFLETVDLDFIVTDPDFRRRGVARRLLEVAFDTLPTQVDRVLLEVGQNNSQAISLYFSMGFMEISRRIRYYRNSEDALILEKRLRPKATSDSP